MSSISFGNIWLLFLALPLAAVFSLLFFLSVRKDNRNGHNVASYVLHLVLAAAIAFAASAPVVTAVLTKTEVYVVADVSYSARRNLDTVDNYIRALTENGNLPRDARLGLVAFGRDYKLICGAGKPSDIASVKNSGVDETGTDICGALEYTAGLFSDGAIKRIVLITDGRDTDMRDFSALGKEVDSLLSKNIKVDAIYIDDNILPGTDEVQLSYVEYTRNAYIGREEKITAVVQSAKDADAVVTLSEGGREISRRAVKLTGGANSVAFDVDTSVAGSHDYSVYVQSEGDTSALNNTCSFTQNVTDELRVLFITDKWEECTTAVERYGDKVKIDIYEDDSSFSSFTKNRYITNLNNPNVVIKRDTTEVPFSVEALCKYDEIALSNVDIMSLSNYTEFVKSLDTVVSAYGKSLITYGNLGIQNREYEELKQLEDMLPVRFGNNDGAPKIYTLIIDSSRSMEQLFHLSVAKQVANSLIKLLKPEDMICIITFASDVRMGLAPTPIKDFEEGELEERINSIDCLQGTLIGKGLQRAYDFLSTQQSSDKQVMLITDGLTYSDESDDPVSVAQNMYSEGIVTSVFDVGRQGDKQGSGNYGDNDNTAAQAAKQMLQDVADKGQGKYYYSNNLESMDEVTFGDIADAMTKSIIEEDTPVTVERRTDGVLEGIITGESGQTTAIPDISGYVYGVSKASADTVLSVEHRREDGTTARPLYSYWNYGDGKVACFTGAFSGDWIKNWSDGGIESSFFANMLTTNIPRGKHVNPYNITLSDEGEYAGIDLTPGGLHYGATAKVDITLPDGSGQTVDMDFKASYYHADIYCAQAGRYEFAVTYLYNGDEYTEDLVYYVDFAPEYDEFAVYDTSALHSAIDGKGMVSSDGALTINNDPDDVGKVTFYLALPSYMLCAALFLADVIIRKLKWKDVVSFFRPNKDKGGKKQ